MKQNFEDFFKEHQNTVYRITRGYVRARDIAQDITTDSFMKVYDQWERVEQMDNPIGYLVRIAVNAAKHYLTQDKFRKMFDIFSLELKCPDKDPEARTIENCEDKELEEAIQTLDEIERSIILLKDIEEMTFVEIAQTLEKNLSTVKSLYRRAKMKLAGILQRNDAMEADFKVELGEKNAV